MFYSLSHLHTGPELIFPGTVLPPDGGAGGQPLPRPNFRIQPITVTPYRLTRMSFGFNRKRRV